MQGGLGGDWIGRGEGNGRGKREGKGHFFMPSS